MKASNQVFKPMFQYLADDSPIKQLVVRQISDWWTCQNWQKIRGK